jgi:hypothetical protein
VWSAITVVLPGMIIGSSFSHDDKIKALRHRRPNAYGMFFMGQDFFIVRINPITEAGND